MKERIDLTGKRIGRLTVIKEVSYKKQPGKHRKWQCVCDCGEVREIFQDRLVKECVMSCGCWQKEIAAQKRTTHGHAHRPVYLVWQNMKARCLNPKHKSWDRYGGRGINVCDRWKDSFINFIEDMGELPFCGAELDRVDNNKGYSKENCRWATRKEQTNNTSRNVFMTINEKTHTIAGWAEQSGLPHGVIMKRFRRGTPQDRIFDPISRHGRKV